MIAEARSGIPCPACGQAGRARVWDALDVPVRACTAVGASLEDALAFPRGDIRLVLCPGCGLVSNEEFDATRLAAAGEGPVDSSIGSSPQLRELARRLVERWGVRRSRVVDIGCAGGDFVSAICEAGDNLGIGIDPLAPAAAPDPRVELVHELYAERHAALPADLVCARFLLEHEAEPRAFAALVRRQVGRSLVAGRPSGLAFFQVPDGRATLERAVPWEVFYEHCQHFSLGSLARLMRSAGLEVLELGALGHHRHLIAVTRAAAVGGPPPAGHELEDDLPALRTAASSFAGRARLRLEWWRRELDAARGLSRIVLWGAGARTSAFLAALGASADAIDCVVDVDPAKRGARMAGTGQEVISPADLRERFPDAVVVMNDLYLDAVREDLARLELSPQLVAA